MTSTISEMALALGDRVELSILGKATILLALGLILAGTARRARASLRHLLLAATFAALLQGVSVTIQSGTAGRWCGGRPARTSATSEASGGPGRGRRG